MTNVIIPSSPHKNFEDIRKIDENKNIIAQGVLLGGNAFDIDANVIYWILRSKRSEL